MTIPEEAFSRAVEIANNYGIRGKRVNIQWIPPRTGSSDPAGTFVVIEKS